MRCALCGTEVFGRPANCPHCGTRLWYDEAEAAAQNQSPGAPWGPSQAAAPPSQPLYPGYAPTYPQYPQEGQAPPPGATPLYPQQTVPGAPYGGYAPPSAPYGAYAPPSVPVVPGGSAPGYPQAPYPPGYGPAQGQPYAPYGPYGYGAPATTPFAPPTSPFAPSATARKRRANPAVVVLSIVAALVVIVVASVGAVYLARGSQTANPNVGISAGSPAATSTLGPTLLYQNTMTTPDSGWPQDQNCFFKSDGYHIVGFHICFAPIADVANVDVKVDMTVLSGASGAPHGIVFRHNGNPDRYAFDLDSYGDWVLFKCIAAQQTCQSVVDYRTNSAIHSGLQVVNTLEVIAIGSHFTFKVNGQEVGTADDSTLTMGAVGFEGHDNSEVVFSNLKITLPH